MNQIVSGIQEKLAQGTTCFHSQTVPGITITQYLKRFTQYLFFTPSDFTAVLIYLDRVTGEVEISPYTIHRLILALIVVTEKFFHDNACKNSFMAEIGGVTIHEINQLEIEVLVLLNFELHISSSQWEKYSVYPGPKEVC